MATFRGRAVRAGSAFGQTGETATAAAARARARERRRPLVRGQVGGIAALRRAFSGDQAKVDTVLHAIRRLRSDRDSMLYTMPRQRFLTQFKETHGVAYPYRVPVRRA